jgi:hypothetical protein
MFGVWSKIDTESVKFSTDIHQLCHRPAQRRTPGSACIVSWRCLLNSPYRRVPDLPPLNARRTHYMHLFCRLQHNFVPCSCMNKIFEDFSDDPSNDEASRKIPEVLNNYWKAVELHWRKSSVRIAVHQNLQDPLHWKPMGLLNTVNDALSFRSDLVDEEWGVPVMNRSLPRAENEPKMNIVARCSDRAV